MRMWMISPSFLCDKHLLGQHAELHMLRGCIEMHKSLKGYIDKGLIQIESINDYHEAVAQEMIYRGFKHNSPLFITGIDSNSKVDIVNSITELKKRCQKCRKRLDGNHVE